MNAKLIIFITPADGESQNEGPFVSTGQPVTKGGYWKKHYLVISTFAHHLEASPKHRAHQLGGQKPYQGKRNVDLTVNAELAGS
jgi:hypothetical protein